MKSKKTIFAFALSLIPMLLLGCTNTPVSSTPTESSSNVSGSSTSSSTDSSSLYWTSTDGNGVHYINGYLGNEENIVIPSVVNGVSIDVLNTLVFADHANLKSVIIPASITVISDGVFSGCSSLVSVSFQGAVTSIGGRAFAGCASLSSIQIPDSVTYIGARAFDGCSSLTSLTLPSKLKYWNEFATSNCSSLSEILIDSNNNYFSSKDGILFNKSLSSLVAFPNAKAGTYQIPSSVTRIESGAFAYSHLLTSLVLPKDLSFIQDGAFQGCDSLVSLTLDSQNEAYTVIDNVLYSKDGTVLVAYLGGLLGPFSIPTSVTTVDQGFFDCKGLSEVTISANVTSLQATSFYDCSSLVSINVDTANSQFGSTQGALFSKDLKTLLFVPNGVSGVVSVPDGTVAIGDGAFHNCYKITGAVWPSSIKTIGSAVFYGCSALASFTCPVPSFYLGKYFFYGCSSLVSINLSSVLSSISEYAFAGCSALSSFSFGSHVTDIGKGCFMNCTGLVSISIPSSLHSLGQYAFYGCSHLTSINIDGYLSIFNSYCFAKCTALETLTFPETTGTSSSSAKPTVTLYEGAFADCSSLRSIVLPSTTTFVGSRAFANDLLLSIYFSASSLDTVTLNSGWNIFSGKGYVYSESQPASTGDYWHYVNGVPTIW